MDSLLHACKLAELSLMLWSQFKKRVHEVVDAPLADKLCAAVTNLETETFELLLSSAAEAYTSSCNDMFLRQSQFNPKILEDKVKQADVFTEEVKTALRELVDSDTAKAFRKSYKKMHSSKGVKDQVTNLMRRVLGPDNATKKKAFDEFSEIDNCDAMADSNKTVAMCTATQSSFREKKTGETRANLIQGAKKAIIAGNVILDPKFMIMMTEAEKMD